MKLKTLLILLFLTISYCSKAQKINGVPISSINEEYMQIIGRPQSFSNKWLIEFDFGQINKRYSAKDASIKDENDNTITFNSMIEALNFMYKNGYEYVDSNIIHSSEVNSIHYYILKKINKPIKQ